jgi:hypothetical protein
MKLFGLFLLLAAAVAFSGSAVAQEGHPLAGTWYGDFGESTGSRHDLTVVMNWDGKVTTGVVNPGPNAVPLKTVTLDIKQGAPGRAAVAAQGDQPAQAAVRGGMPTFLVHFEADAKNKAGGTDRFVFQGAIENPVAGNRVIRGTWTCGSDKGNFVLRRL